jgi:hypothetical protein
VITEVLFQSPTNNPNASRPKAVKRRAGGINQSLGGKVGFIQDIHCPQYINAGRVLEYRPHAYLKPRISLSQ